jgi:predicted nucleic acid-binding protein
MRTYLLDTCIWSYWFNPKRVEHKSVSRWTESLNADSVLGLSVITAGEIEFGLCWADIAVSGLKAEYRQFIEAKHPKIFDLDRHTAAEYGRLKALLCERSNIPRSEKNKAGRLKQLIDPANSQVIGIDENDLWIVAQAVVKNLVLVTNDKRQERIHRLAGDELQVENWCSDQSLR